MRFSHSNWRFLILIVWGLAIVEAQAGFQIKRPHYKIIDRYLSLQKEYRQKVCGKGEFEKFDQLYRDYRGDGSYVPFLDQSALDTETIRNDLSALDLKLAWIQKVKKQIQAYEGVIYVEDLTKAIRANIKELLTIKKQVEWDGDLSTAHIVNSQKALKLLQEQFGALVERLFFLKNFVYPVDYAQLRQDYDAIKDLKDRVGQQKSNQIYFYRKIVEDGAQLANHTRSDRMLRALMSTLDLRLQRNQETFLAEELRYDLVSFLDLVEQYCKRGKGEIVERLTEWEERTRQQISFYQKLLKDFKEKPDGEIKKYLAQKNSSRHAIVEFTNDQYQAIYQFWQKQSDVMRALFVIDTILINEVGALDGREGAERAMLIQLILNRSQIGFYTTLNDQSDLGLRLSQAQKKKQPWLNLLFKEGEFSFTYYFIPSSARIYCIDQNPYVESLRKENLKLALANLTRKPNPLGVVRFFSRQSMIGRMDMTTIWSEFTPLEERPGPIYAFSKRYLRDVLLNKFQYLYRFTHQQQLFYVIALPHLGDVRLVVQKVVDAKSGKTSYQFYKYLNVHHFKYFAPKARMSSSGRSN